MAKKLKRAFDNGKLWNPPATLTSEELIGKEATLTIASAGKEEVPDPTTGQPKLKPIIRFRETPRYMVCNRTNEDFCVAAFGKSTAEWIGKRVTIFAAEVRFGREKTTGLRLKLPKESNAKPEPSAIDGAPDPRPGDEADTENNDREVRPGDQHPQEGREREVG